MPPQQPPFTFLYDVLRGLSVIETLVYNDHCRAWFIHGFVLETPEDEACPHETRRVECRICGGAGVVTPSQLYALQTNLSMAVGKRESIIKGRRGIDGFPVLVEYDPSSVMVDAPQYRRALKAAEDRCWDVWKQFTEEIRFGLRARY